jgi:hypothetical protein
MIQYFDQIIGLFVGVICTSIGFEVFNPFKNNIERINWFMRNKKLMKILGVLLISINLITLIFRFLK